MLSVRPINNVVDITNFVLLEYGQPLHAFDLNKFKTPLLGFVKQMLEKTVTLDEVERELIPSTWSSQMVTKLFVLLVLWVASTEVDDNTTDVLLECAYFHTSTVRKQSRRLGLTSDSSYRFEHALIR